jgi:hypothetical protein
MGSPPAGTIYAFNPDSPGTGQSATDRGNFTSDFAGFVQGSTETIRTDSPFRVLFRKDVSPDPTRIEVILELGHPTTDGSAANSGPFTFTIFQGSNQVFQGAFPSMGWFTRWRWNPTPRPEFRTRASLLPSNLNLVPNFSQSLATAFRAVDCGGSGSGSNIITAYSSAYALGYGNNINPLGVNENCSIATNTGGVGGRPELGIVTEWQANYLIDGNTAAQTAMYVLAEVAGGMPWVVRDLGTGAPVDLVANPDIGFGGGGGNYDTPQVTVPSGGGTGVWTLEFNHLPSLSYVPYILTGDPFYLENHQFAANWIIGSNWYHRFNGFKVNTADPNSPTAGNAGETIPLLPSYRGQTRGFGWGLRDFGMFYLATPGSVPSWLLPKSYAKSVLDQNQVYADNNSGSPNGSGANNAYVLNNTHLATFGSAPGSFEDEEGFFLSYALLGLGFVVNQCGLSSWLPYLRYFAKLPVGLASGTSGWPSNWPSPYTIPYQAVSTDYDGNPATITSFADMWAYHWQNAVYCNGLYWSSAGSPNLPSSAFPAWRPNTAYTCNSWIVEVRTGWPVLPNAGDVVSLTIAGTFTGSPITISHIVTASDVTYLSGLSLGNVTGLSTPIIDDLIAKINASAAGTAGISAATTVAGITTGYWFNRTATGRMFLSFDSAVVGNIVVTGSYTVNGPNTAASLYIQPNGDPVNNGAAGSNLFGRPLGYQAATTGMSGGSGGPTGHALQTPTLVDGAVKWCYVPEAKTWPLVVPSSQIPAAPILAQIFATLRNGAPEPQYAVWALAGMNCAVTAGIAGASGAAANLQATVNDWFTNEDTMLHSQFTFSIAP